MADISFENGGATVRIRPLSDGGRAWIERYVDYEAQVEGAVIVEARAAEEVATAARHDGLQVDYPAR
jgi:hypothetical protein